MAPAPKPPRQTGLIVLVVVSGVAALALIVAIVVVLARPTTVVDLAGDISATTTSTTAVTTTTTTTAQTSPVVTISAPASPPPSPLAPVVDAPRPTDPPTLRNGIDVNSLSVDGIEPLTLGMSISEAEARTGLAATRSMCGGGVNLVGVPPGVFISFTNGILASVFVKESNVLTRSGVGVGTSVDELQRKVAGLTQKPSPYAELTLYILRSGDGARELVFWVQSNSVSSMVAAFGNDGEGETC